jgi:hypothetical protein
MSARVVIACLGTAACALIVDIGKADGIQPIRLDRSINVPAASSGASALLPAPPRGVLGMVVEPTADGGRDAVLAIDLPVFTAEQSAAHRARFGIDKIGAIRGVTLEIISASYDGIDMTRIAAPTFTLAGNTIVPPDRSTDLDSASLDDLRRHLLLAEAVTLPLTIRFHIPAGAEDALGAILHVQLEIQPTLHVDAGKSW